MGVLLALVVESAARADGGVDTASLARAVQRRVEDLTIYRSSIEASSRAPAAHGSQTFCSGFRVRTTRSHYGPHYGHRLG